MNAELVKAQQAFDKASAKEKQLLKSIFGAEHFEPKATDQVKTFEDACKVLKLSPASVLPFKKAVTTDQKGLNAAAKLFVIARALNQGWQPDWTDSDEYKWYPWFNSYKSGVGCSDTGTDCDFTITDVGSRLCFKTEDLAAYAGKQFLDIYNDYLTIQ